LVSTSSVALRVGTAVALVCLLCTREPRGEYCDVELMRRHEADQEKRSSLAWWTAAVRRLFERVSVRCSFVHWLSYLSASALAFAAAGPLAAAGLSGFGVVLERRRNVFFNFSRKGMAEGSAEDAVWRSSLK
jgi:hypothetical protein